MKPDDPNRPLASALGRIPSGIFVLTVARDGVETGMLASWGFETLKIQIHHETC